MTHRYVPFVFFALIVLLIGGPANLHAQDELPYTLEQVVRLVESGAFSDDDLLELVRESCLGFVVNEQSQQTLLEAGASQDLIRALRGVCVRRTTVVVWPADLEVVVGSSGILRATALLDPDSAQIPNVVFEWNSEDTTVANVAGGVVVGKAPGETRIVATTEDGHSGSAVVLVVAAPAVAEVDSLRVTAPKSVGTAAVLGIFPGGGEFYVGNTAKGTVVLVGAAAALTAGFLITSEDTLSVSRELLLPPGCTGSSCQYEVKTTAEVEETDYIIVGAAVAGAFWLYGLIDGIVTAKRTHALTEEPSQANGGLSLEIAPRDGIRVNLHGETEFTFIRIRS
jgi:hypothetical protein